MPTAAAACPWDTVPMVDGLPQRLDTALLSCAGWELGLGGQQAAGAATTGHPHHPQRRAVRQQLASLLAERRVARVVVPPLAPAPTSDPAAPAAHTGPTPGLTSTDVSGHAAAAY